MPTKRRLVLEIPGGEMYCGGVAIAMLTQAIGKRLMDVDFPVEAHDTRLKKYMFFAKFLPRGFKLHIIREPRHTRPNKSLFLSVWKYGQKKRVHPEPVKDLRPLAPGDLGWQWEVRGQARAPAMQPYGLIRNPNNNE